MLYRISLILLTLTCLFCFSVSSYAQEANIQENNNPVILYSGTPKKYEIGGIKVEGVKNYEDYVLIGLSGLSVGQVITVPGDDITSAVKRYWRHGLFSDVQILAEKIVDNKIYLKILLTQRPRIADIRYHGVKKSEREDLEAKLGLVKGSQITPNLIDRAKILIKKHFDEKGFKNAEVTIIERDLADNKEQVDVDVMIDKKEKVKVHQITIDGNTVLTDKKLKRVMKKTNEKNKLVNIFRSKKFIEEKYEEDKQLIIDKYNELGYRDAQIVVDSVTPYDDRTVDVYMRIEEGDKYYLRNVTWVGNTVFPADMLDEQFRMKRGDVYNQKLMNERLSGDEDAIGNNYYNRGYVFYNLDPVEVNIDGDSIDLEMRIQEGPQASINKVRINGNDRLYEHVIRRELRTKPGELFSKSDLMRSAREIAQTGHFDPETMDIKPEPNEENGTVDLVYNLESKANDQIEFSAGWGQTGVIGKLSLKFTNFSIKNLLNPKSFKGIIPQGDGQTFTISAQTNARYYQQYSISFYDPWFGGKRPNSFQFSAYYSRQTGIESSFLSRSYNSLYNNSLYGGYWGNSYLGNSYYDDYYQNAYENALDPNKSLQMIGVSFGFGKRLEWPDDYFTFMAELGYQAYILKNWEYLYYMQNGTSHSFTLGLTLGRSSIDNPIYTRRGSQFTLSAQFTPPYSLFSKKDYKSLYESSSRADREELYRWIEYYKIKFKSRVYTPLNNSEKYTLVLMGRADFGLLGSYNKYKQTPFETFHVGGDGMTGSYTYATETIGLRGYDNGALTPYSDGRAYTRFSMELHFPFLLQPSSTIYGLAFVEGGNAWTSLENFNPFSLKRSAGVGVRIFLPMIGLMGIDWAYGFDKVQGEKGGGHFHFILGQEF